MIRISIALTILASASISAAAGHDRSEGEPAIQGSASLDPKPLQNEFVGPRPVLELRAPQDRQLDENADKPAANPATDAAASGALSPFSMSPGVPHAASAVALTGYDTAAHGLRARGSTEGRLLSFLSARVEYEHGPANGPSDRVSLGLRATLLNQAAHGVELGAVVLYQPRDFRGEGDVVGGLLLARRFDRLTLVLNPLVGSDAEATISPSSCAARVSTKRARGWW